MEVYTVAFNRGSATATRPGDEFANVRRIGGPRFDFYSEENRKAMSRAEQEAAWERWNTLSFLGGAREPARARAGGSPTVSPATRPTCAWPATASSSWNWWTISPLRSAKGRWASDA